LRKSSVELKDEADLAAAQLGERRIREVGERVTVNDHAPLGGAIQPAD